jgi:hypothetical protein
MVVPCTALIEDSLPEIKWMPTSKETHNASFEAFGSMPVLAFLVDNDDDALLLLWAGLSVERGTRVSACGWRRVACSVHACAGGPFFFPLFDLLLTSISY